MVSPQLSLLIILTMLTHKDTLNITVLMTGTLDFRVELYTSISRSTLFLDILFSSMCQNGTMHYFLNSVNQFCRYKNEKDFTIANRLMFKSERR